MYHPPPKNFSIPEVDQIGVLADSILNITAQTNLLALNASNDSATGTTNIAQKTVVIVKGSEAVMNGAKTAEASAAELHKNVNNVVID